MHVVLSPYHLTTREPPAMAALLLAETVTTLVPSARSGFGPAEFLAAARRSEKYARWVESWAWTLPLWNEGVLRSACEGVTPAGDVHDAFRVIEDDPEFDALRPLLRPELFDDDALYLDALAADLLKGGPDPGLSIPVAAGLDRFATRHGLAVVRACAASVAQHAEARFAEEIFSFAAPVLLQANGEHVLRARRVLGPALASLRDAVGGAAAAWGENARAARATPAPVRDAAGAYAAAFDRARAELCTCDKDEARVVDGLVAVSVTVLPTDAALRSGLAAVRSLAGGGVSSRPSPGSVLPVVRDPLAGGRFTALTVRAIGRPGVGAGRR